MTPEYVGGFIDGDGTIGINKIDGGYQLQVYVTQCNTDVLIKFQQQYGGIIYNSGKRKETQRTQYSWKVCGKIAENILDDLEKGCILKYDRALIAKEMLKYNKKLGYKKEKEELYEKMHKLNSREIISEKFPFERVGISYIAGLFDAEGSIHISQKNRIYGGYRFKISQKNYPIILKHIKEYFGFGSATDLCYLTYNNSIKCHINEMMPELIVKKKQAEALTEYIDHISKCSGKKYTDETHEIRKKIYEVIDADKHTDSVLTNEEIQVLNEISKETYKYVKVKVYKDPVETHKKQSEAKIGSKNPNYGKKRDIAHTMKIMKSNENTSRAISDEDILLVRELYGNGENIASISDSTGFNRDKVSKIVHMKIVPSFERDDEYYKNKIEETKKGANHAENTSKGKRKLEFSTYIEILKNKGKGIPSTKLNEHLKATDKSKITSDIVKNIWNGRTKLFGNEFIEGIGMTYEEYLGIIGKK